MFPATHRASVCERWSLPGASFANTLSRASPRAPDGPASVGGHDDRTGGGVPLPDFRRFESELFDWASGANSGEGGVWILGKRVVVACLLWDPISWALAPQIPVRRAARGRAKPDQFAG